MGSKVRVALVTGGMGGLGEAICRRLASELNYTVVAMHSPGRTDVAEWLGTQESEGFRFDTQQVDVASYASINGGQRMD